MPAPLPVPSLQKQQEIANSFAECLAALTSRGVAGIVEDRIDMARWYLKNGWKEDYEETVRFLSTPCQLLEGWVKSREEVIALIEEKM